VKSLSVFAILAACGTSESGALLTKGISADMSVTATGSSTVHVGAELFEGNPDQLIFVDLQSGDQLLADAGGQLVPLSKSELLNIISYDADLPAGNLGDPITIAFERQVDAGAPTSTATLPDPFTLDPVAATTSRAAAMTVTYSPPGTDDVTWQASGDCIQTATGSIPTDSGSIAIAAGTLVATPSQPTATCQVTLTVSRQRAGTLDPHFEGGSILGEQARTAMFTSTP
jgi:hypothetical protein